MEEDYRDVMAREDRLTELENELSVSKSRSNVGLGKTTLIDKENKMGELTPSQYIKGVDIDDEYDKLHAKLEEARKLLTKALWAADGRLFNVNNEQHADVFNEVRDYLA